MHVAETNYLKWLKDNLESSNYWKNLGMTFDRLEKGDVRVKLIATDKVLNSNHLLHGGAIVSLLDVVAAVTLRSYEPVQVSTVSLTTHFISPVEKGMTVYATASVVSSKKRIQYVDAKVVNEDGNIIADSVGVFALVRNISAYNYFEEEKNEV